MTDFEKTHFTKVRTQMGTPYPDLVQKNYYYQSADARQFSIFTTILKFDNLAMISRMFFASKYPILCCQILFLFHTFYVSTSSKLEWILLKYELTEVQQLTSSDLQFSICACFSPTENPSNCQCDTSKIVGRPIHKGLFPSNCLARPVTTNGKCAVVNLDSPAESLQFVYVRVAIGQMVLTSPEFQKLTADGARKSILRLSTKEAGKFIDIAYSVQIHSKDDNKLDKITERAMPSSKTLKTAKSWPLKTKLAKLSRIRMATPKTSMSTTTGTTTIQPTSIHPMPLSMPSEVCKLIGQMGMDEFQIRQFLMADAARERVHPLQFDVERYKRAVLNIHNRYRQLHGTSDLAHDSECEQSAKHWADTVAHTANCLSHEPQKRFGESLFFYSTLEPELSDPETLAEATVRTFYVEGRDYRRSGLRWDAVRHGHFTQMLWRGTQRLGVGVSLMTHPAGRGQCTPSAGGGRHREAWLFNVVLRYEPAGNIQWGGIDSFGGNVTMKTDGGKLECLSLK